MRIAVWHNLPSGGGKRALYYHVKGLVERGHSIEVWSPPTADLSYLPLSPFGIEHVVPLNLPSHRVPFSRLWKLYGGILDEIDAMDGHCQDCAAQIASGKFDLLFANSCRQFAVSSIGKAAALPGLLYLGEPKRRLYEAQPELPWIALPPAGNRLQPAYLKRWFMNLVNVQRDRVQARAELEGVRAYQRVLVNSYYSRESLLRTYGVDAKVCYLGVDTNIFKNLHLERLDFVVGVGSITPSKNIELVLRSLGKIPAPRPRLVWLGNITLDSYLHSLKALAQSLQVDFQPLQLVKDEVLVEILNQARMMVYTPHLEPFGLAPLEANACGTPVVTVAEGGVRETILHEVNGLVADSDPNALAGAVQRLSADPGLAAVLGRNGQEIVQEKWTWRAALDRMEQHLFDVRQRNILSPEE